MKRARASQPAGAASGPQRDIEAFRRSAATRPRTECVIDARLETTPASSDRLLEALNSGARDFVLTATDGRVSARVRLTIANVSMTQHSIGGTTVVVDWAQCTVANGPRRESVSRTELRLLAALLDAGGRAVTRAELIERIWPDDWRAMPERENSLAVYVCCLRKRLTSIGVGGVLRTLRRVGYQLLVQATD